MNNFQFTVLPNGMIIATDTVPDTKYFKAQWALRVGAEYDPPETPGIAHFFEHLLGEASEKFPDFHWYEFDKWGSDTGLFTGPRKTSALITALPSRFAQWTDYVGAAISAPLLKDDHIESERRIIDKEFENLQSDIDQERLCEILQKIYPNHPMSRPVLGTQESINHFITADKIRAFHEKYYVGGNMAYFVSGPFSHEEVLNHAVPAFSGVKAEKRKSFSPPAVAVDQSENRQEERSSQRIDVILPGAVYGRGDKIINDYLILFNAAFAKSLRDNGLSYGSKAFQAEWGDAGNINIEIETGPDNVREVLKIMRETLRKPELFMNRAGLDKMTEMEELQNSRFKMDPQSRIFWMINCFCATGMAQSPETIMDVYRAADMNDLKFVHQHMLESEFSIYGWGPCEDWPSIKEARELLRGKSAPMPGLSPHFG